MSYIDFDVIILFIVIGVMMLDGWRKRHLWLLTILLYWVITCGIPMQ